MQVKDKSVIVTGASSGIGLAAATLLTRKGAKVALVARTKSKLENISKKLPGSLVVVADMTREKDIKDMVKKVRDHFGRIDVLINNAGRGYDAPVEKIDITTYRHIIDLDLIGPVIAMQAVIPLMRQQGGGSIINISSGTALMYLPDMSAYSSLKRALVGISLTAREELKSDHINVSVIYPYITLTDFEKNTIRNAGDNKEEWDPGDSDLPKPDTAGYVAEKILEAIDTEEGEVFAHDWMKNRE